MLLQVDVQNSGLSCINGNMINGTTRILNIRLSQKFLSFYKEIIDAPRSFVLYYFIELRMIHFVVIEQNERSSWDNLICYVLNNNS